MKKHILIDFDKNEAIDLTQDNCKGSDCNECGRFSSDGFNLKVQEVVRKITDSLEGLEKAEQVNAIFSIGESLLEDDSDFVKKALIAKLLNNLDLL